VASSNSAKASHSPRRRGSCAGAGEAFFGLAYKTVQDQFRFSVAQFHARVVGGEPEARGPGHFDLFAIERSVCGLLVHEEEPLRLQMVWMKPCLTADLLREFRDLWHTYTAPSHDRQSTTLRDLTRDESIAAIESLVALANRVAVAAASPVDEPFATLADLG